jgi:hypothetical protein
MDRTFFYKDKAGEWRWKIVAPNEEIIDSSSEGFTREEDARHNYVRAGHKLPDPIDGAADRAAP